MNDNPYPTFFSLDCRQKPVHVHLSQMSELTLLLLSEHVSPFFIYLSRHNPSALLLSSSRHVIPPAPIPSILLLRSSISRLLRTIKRRRLRTVTDDALHARTSRLHADRLVCRAIAIAIAGVLVTRIVCV